MQSQTAANGPNHDARTPQTARRSRVFLLIGAGLIAAGVGLLLWRDRVPAPPAMPAPSTVDALTPQTVAAMDSPAFAHSDGWRVDAAGADPSEPADPWPSLPARSASPTRGASWRCNWRPALTGATCSSPWTVRRPTLPAITGNVDSRGAPAGYTTLYAPEDHRRRPLGRRTAQRCGPAADGSPHQARVEIWRSWGQTPLRAVAIDALPPAAPPAWPGVLLLVSGLLCVLAAWAWWPMSQAVRPTALAQLANVADAKYAGDWARRLALGGGALTVLGALLGLWWLTLAGVGLLALAGLLRPVLWLKRSWPRCLSTSASPCRCCPSATFPSSTWACWAASACSWSTGCSFRDRRRAARRRWRLPPSSWPAGRW
ncbi:MAG: hypothetical protein R3A10_02950 [Caldilineaceae bacterium]